MNVKSKYFPIKLILFIQLIFFSFKQSSLQFISYSDIKCSYDSQNSSFDINAILLFGNLTKSMFGNFKIKANVELECIFPEITNNTRNETIDIKIPCYFDNKQHDLSIYFEGESESNQLTIDY